MMHLFNENPHSEKSDDAPLTFKTVIKIKTKQNKWAVGFAQISIKDVIL